jgi:hypothetical protein
MTSPLDLHTLLRTKITLDNIEEDRRYPDTAVTTILREWLSDEIVKAIDRLKKGEDREA